MLPFLLPYQSKESIRRRIITLLFATRHHPYATLPDDTFACTSEYLLVMEETSPVNAWAVVENACRQPAALSILQHLLACHFPTCSPRDGSLRSVMVLSAQLDRVDITRLMIDHWRAKNMTCDLGPALLSAARHGNVEVALELLSFHSGNYCRTRLSADYTEGHKFFGTCRTSLITHQGAALRAAAERGDLTMCELLLAHAVDLKSEQSLALHVAAQYGHLRVLGYLLESTHHVEINSQDDDGITALFIAAQHGQTEAVKLLLKHGARTDIERNDTTSPLWIACRGGHNKAVEVLLKAGAKVNKPNSRGITPLWVAIERNHTELVRLLVDSGADCDYYEREGEKRERTSYECLVWQRACAEVQQIVRAGRDEYMEVEMVSVTGKVQAVVLVWLWFGLISVILTMLSWY